MNDLYRNTLTYIFYCGTTSICNKSTSIAIVIDVYRHWHTIDSILSEDLQSFKHTINVRTQQWRSQTSEANAKKKLARFKFNCSSFSGGYYIHDWRLCSIWICGIFNILSMRTFKITLSGFVAEPSQIWVIEFWCLCARRALAYPRDLRINIDFFIERNTIKVFVLFKHFESDFVCFIFVFCQGFDNVKYNTSTIRILGKCSNYTE